VYGTSTWDVNLNETTQIELVITASAEETNITVDNLEVAQFIYLLLTNKNLRNIIHTIGNKAVLILGRFSDERKAVLYGIAEELRKMGGKYIPIIFDFEPPVNLDLAETVATLAHLSRFVFADLTDPNSVPAELMSFVEKLLSVPVQPLFCPVPGHAKEFPLFQHIQRYPQVLSKFPYEKKEDVIAHLPVMITALEERVKQMRATIEW
jgi:hypothetical protein